MREYRKGILAQVAAWIRQQSENFTTADIHGKIIIGIFVALMCFCLWLMQYNSMKRNMAQSAANKQT